MLQLDENLLSAVENLVQRPLFVIVDLLDTRIVLVLRLTARPIPLLLRDLSNSSAIKICP